VQQPSGSAPVDGRTLRSLRTREAIVDATIGLLEEGDLRPTAPRVAERAAVSVRSVFQHFDDLETLHASVAERLVDRVAVLLVPVPADLPLAERLERFVHQRALLLEAITPIRRAADVHGPFSTEITARLRAGQAFLREELVRTFGPELDAAGSDRADVLDALDAALSWGTWNGLRASVGRSQGAAERVLRRLASAVLASR
jgi:AcrR family transcriptional regulator